MAIDRKLKQKRKRQERQKAARLQRDRLLRLDKAEDLYWCAHDAYEDHDYRRAYDMAMKALALHPRNQEYHDLALSCAIKLDDNDSIHAVAKHCWENGLLMIRQNALAYANQSLIRKDYAFAIEVLDAVLKDSRAFNGGLTVKIKKDAGSLLAYCKSMQAQRARFRDEAAAAGDRPRPSRTKEASVRRAQSSRGAEQPKPAAPEQAPGPSPVELDILYAEDTGPALEAVRNRTASDPAHRALALAAYGLSFRASYDQLICLSSLRNVTSLWYQEETARKVMRTFRGRAILADEVGLGKTIEACIVLKEYIMRGLVRSALILAPSSLVDQWQDELQDKLDLAVVSSNDALFRNDPVRFWQEPFILLSLQTARSKGHFDAVIGRAYDMVIVDEAHHLKNKSTQNWKLVNSLQKTFLLLLTATPVQNNLEELYNLVTLLKPGHLKTRSAFKQEFVSKADPTDPLNREKLRELLKEVMVRNTRSVTQLNLPPRYASTIRVSPTAEEELFYEKISCFVADASREATGIQRLALRRLLEAAGSSHLAALRMLERGSAGRHSESVADMIEAGAAITHSGKAAQVLDMLRASSDKILVFVNYRATLEYMEQQCRHLGIAHAVYRGGMTAAQKQDAIAAFRDSCRVLLATETGGEGHNLQFCHTMINYDLPWNPMSIEQRIGRIHRIGQENEVKVYNFCAAGSIEDYILDVLDRKINMFELVVGEVDMILGRLASEQDFSDMVYDLWVHTADEVQRRQAFDALAGRLKNARRAYEKTKQLDEALFRENFEA